MQPDFQTPDVLCCQYTLWDALCMRRFILETIYNSSQHLVELSN